ncbi:acyl-CoA dehydrogenase family protein [Novosphingobium malaysiense]|uniref:Acyl-CoA dehydrogenase n=1 Tax=Novosphingobium malaysiense TaxID=1348853 RepID=A0A0B1ZKL6_9SPHN|nr:acyl-CoA dehydrogenase family protein [Novosphingobium malaysiense]KHK89840.1 acyl-CoA dehydrogenase [Novosphingobium malaysiense]
MSEEIEPVEAFRLRAREWIKANLGPMQRWDMSQHCESDEEELEAVARDRMLQRKLYDGGFAGICFPKEYGGQGLTPDHNRAFSEELSGHEYPSRFSVPTFSPCASVLLEFGTPEQKAAHLPAILKGEEVWVQLLSEPGGGSDVAGITTRATRDGDHWVLNGSKVWTSRAWWADWGLILTRTNWDVPKHRGMTVFILPLQQPGVEISRIERLNGESESCEEFFTDVRIPDSDRVGEVDAGWTIGTRWMYHERLGHNSPYVTTPVGSKGQKSHEPSVVEIARKAGRLDDPAALELIGEHRALGIVTHELQRRIGDAAASGKGNKDLSSVDRVFRGLASVRRATIAFDLAGSDASVWDENCENPTDAVGMQFLMRQVSCIGGGTTEISRNVIAERVLAMPREPSGDKGVPFRDVPKGPNRSR